MNTFYFKHRKKQTNKKQNKTKQERKQEASNSTIGRPVVANVIEETEISLVVR